MTCDLSFLFWLLEDHEFESLGLQLSKVKIAEFGALLAVQMVFPTLDSLGTINV